MSLSELCSAPHCTAKASGACPVCFRVGYCSPACQAAAWAAHARVCVRSAPPPPLLLDALVLDNLVPLRVPFDAYTTVGGLVAKVRARAALPPAVCVFDAGQSGEALLAEGDTLCSVLQPRPGGLLPRVRIAAALAPLAAALSPLVAAALPPLVAALPPVVPAALLQVADAPARIILSITGYGFGGTTKMRVKADAYFSNILASYTRHKNINSCSIFFVFEGMRISAEDTPESLRMEVRG